MICTYSTYYREPASSQQALYPDCKNHAVPSLRRDTLSAKVPGSLPALSSDNTCEIIPPGRYMQAGAHPDTQTGTFGGVNAPIMTATKRACFLALPRIKYYIWEYGRIDKGTADKKYESDKKQKH